MMSIRHATIGKGLFFLVVLAVTLTSCTQEKKSISTSLPRSKPSAEGVNPASIVSFLDAVEKSKNEMHSIMIIRHGNVIAEGWWNPYAAELKHTMYSCSKSFTSTAAGFAIAEKKLSLEDKVISFFPNELPDSVSDHLQSMRVKDLLSMSAGQDPDPTWSLATADSNWVKSFLALPVKNQPGSVFLYNSMATYMVSAIVQKVTNQKIQDYLQPRLFEPLGISGIDWESDTQGINTGGWGLRVKTEDMAKLGLLYLQKGKWNGNQLLSEAWVAEATSAVMKDSAPGLEPEKRSSSDWAQGYGYQFWQCRHGAVRGDGAFGQYIIMLPEQDAVIAITSETADMQDELNLVWEHLLPGFQQGAISGADSLDAQVAARMKALALPVPSPSDSPVAQLLQGKAFRLAANDLGYEQITVSFTDGNCHLTLQKKGESYPLNFGYGQWLKGDTKRLGPNLIPHTGTFVGLPPLQVAGAYRWDNNATLHLTLRYIESPHHEDWLLSFDKNDLKLTIRWSVLDIVQEFTGEGI